MTPDDVLELAKEWVAWRSERDPKFPMSRAEREAVIRLRSVAEGAAEELKVQTERGSYWFKFQDKVCLPMYAAYADGRDGALEEAAKVCDEAQRTRGALASTPWEQGYEAAERVLGRDIRALKSNAAGRASPSVASGDSPQGASEPAPAAPAQPAGERTRTFTEEALIRCGLTSDNQPAGERNAAQQITESARTGTAEAVRTSAVAAPGGFEEWMDERFVNWRAWGKRSGPDQGIGPENVTVKQYRDCWQAAHRAGMTTATFIAFDRIKQLTNGIRDDVERASDQEDGHE